MPRDLVILECSECGRRNYTTDKNKRTVSGRLSKKKYCSSDRRHTVHVEKK